MTRRHCLSQAILDPVAGPDKLDTPFWQAAEQSRLVVQRCKACLTWRWIPEWICHNCHSFDFSFDEVEPYGVLESWARVCYPVHPLLKESVPYVVVLIRIPQAGNVRMVGNYSGQVEDNLVIGSKMEAVFERHLRSGQSSYALVQWRLFVN